MQEANSTVQEAFHIEKETNHTIQETNRTVQEACHIVQEASSNKWIGLLTKPLPLVIKNQNSKKMQEFAKNHLKYNWDTRIMLYSCCYQVQFDWMP